LTQLVGTAHASLIGVEGRASAFAHPTIEYK
jgi:hypothetical protein